MLKRKNNSQYLNLIYRVIFILLMCTCNITESFTQNDTIFRYFAATQTENGVLISFTIKGGITCSGVTIERSTNQIDYEVIHEFIGVCGGISTDESYAFTDENPHRNTTSFYRLDLGSLRLYSDVLSVLFLDYGEGGIAFFPNPCIEECSLYFTNGSHINHQAFLYNQNGKLVLFETMNSSRWIIQRKNLPSGIYFYRLFRDDEERSSGKVFFP